MKPNFVLYAPNLHTGGGLVLLRALLAAWDPLIPMHTFLDVRARKNLTLPPLAIITWVKPRVASRLLAELRLSIISRKNITVLCLHGLPPILPNAGRVVVFQQNRIYLDLIPLAQFTFKTRVRLMYERAVSRFFRRRVAEYIVQTTSMRRALLAWYGPSKNINEPVVKIYPFVDQSLLTPPTPRKSKTWDFIYVADGEAHKNHRNLLAAWGLLAIEGLRPKLALTLNPRDAALKHEIDGICMHYDLNVTHLDPLTREEMFNLYACSGAMVFPSTAESFGLPLIEAQHAGLPIIASELDFVRDVCEPVQTFDPASPVSIARAIKRFLHQSEPRPELHSAKDFWQNLLK